MLRGSGYCLLAWHVVYCASEHDLTELVFEGSNMSVETGENLSSCYEMYLYVEPKTVV